jgi:hypothetical protein
MAEGAREVERIACADLTVHAADAMAVATLRYFTADGACAAAVREVTGIDLPAPLEAHESQGVIFAWRSPTETLCLAPDGERLAALAARLTGVRDGCLVDLTGGLEVVRVTGERTSELLCRLGGGACVPHPGMAWRGRLADVAVLALALRRGETLLVVDRALRPHLMGWIRGTLTDLRGGAQR